MSRRGETDEREAACKINQASYKLITNPRRRPPPPLVLFLKDCLEEGISERSSENDSKRDYEIRLPSSPGHNRKNNSLSP